MERYYILSRFTGPGRPYAMDVEVKARVLSESYGTNAQGDKLSDSIYITSTLILR
jgi:hypothetical protein